MPGAIERGTLHRSNAPNFLQASAQILAPGLPGELRQNLEGSEVVTPTTLELTVSKTSI
jgi:hypothetical protein